MALPAGTYLINTRLDLHKSMTLKTVGMTDTSVRCGNGLPCATLVASSALYQHHGILFSANQSNVTIDHIILDGDRFKRLSSAAYAKCADPNPALRESVYGFNGNILNCTNCKIQNSVSTRALCGTGLSFTGPGGTIRNNLFSQNGDWAVGGAWADGLTIASDNALIENNTFEDNSDIGLVLANGPGNTVRNNTVRQTNKNAFAGMQFDNFNGSYIGSYIGAVIYGNVIDCATDRCFFAVNFGPKPWYESASIYGGTFRNNTVAGGAITMNVDGAGTAANPLRIENNVIGPVRSTLANVRCSRSPNDLRTVPRSLFNMHTVDAQVVLVGQAAPTSQNLVHNCQGG